MLDEGTRCPGTRVTSSCELPRVCWEPNPDPIPEQPVLLPSDPPLQSRLGPLFEDYQCVCPG